MTDQHTESIVNVVELSAIIIAECLIVTLIISLIF